MTRTKRKEEGEKNKIREREREKGKNILVQEILVQEQLSDKGLNISAVHPITLFPEENEMKGVWRNSKVQNSFWYKDIKLSAETCLSQMIQLKMRNPFVLGIQDSQSWSFISPKAHREVGKRQFKEDLHVLARAESSYSHPVFTKHLVHSGIHCGRLGGLLSIGIWFGAQGHYGACG